MIDPKQFKNFISNVLQQELEAKYTTMSATYQLLMTSAAESNFGEYLYQVNGGHARGIFQIEPNTEKLVWKWCIENNDDLFSALVNSCTGDVFGGTDLVGNLKYQIILARANYWAWPHPLPTISDPLTDQDIEELATYWKRYWNTYKGAGNVPEAIEKYKKYVGYSI